MEAEDRRQGQAQIKFSDPTSKASVSNPRKCKIQLICLKRDYDNVQCWIQNNRGQIQMALAFLQHLWQHCSWLLTWPHTSTLLSSEFLPFLHPSLSSLKTACPHSLYRPFKLDHGFAALCVLNKSSPDSLYFTQPARRQERSSALYKLSDWLAALKDPSPFFPPPILTNENLKTKTFFVFVWFLCFFL